jgi:hypothetical protein
MSKAFLLSQLLSLVKLTALITEEEHPTATDLLLDLISLLLADMVLIETISTLVDSEGSDQVEI